MQRTTLIASLCLAALALCGVSVVAADIGTLDRPVAQDHDDSDRLAVDVVDPDDELTAEELERTRSLVADADDAVAGLADRFDGESVTLTVDGIDPSERVHIDATASGGGPETIVVADLAGESVTVEDGVLVDDSEVVSRPIDSENVTVVESGNDTTWTGEGAVTDADA